MYFYYSLEDRGPLVEIKIGSSFQPFEGTSEATNPLRSPLSSQKRPAAPPQLPPSLPQLPQDVALEKYSGLRLRWNTGGFLTVTLVNFKLTCRKIRNFLLCHFFPLQKTARFLQRDGTEDGWPSNGSPVSAAGAFSSREAGRQWLGDVCSTGQQGHTKKQQQCRCSPTFLFLIWIVDKFISLLSSPKYQNVLLYSVIASCRGKPSASGSWMTSITWTCLSLCSCLVTYIKNTGRRNLARSSASSTPTPWSRKMDMMGWVDAGWFMQVTIAWRHPCKSFFFSLPVRQSRDGKLRKLFYFLNRIHSNYQFQ